MLVSGGGMDRPMFSSLLSGIWNKPKWKSDRGATAPTGVANLYASLEIS